MTDTTYKLSLGQRLLRWLKGFKSQWQLQSMAIPGVVYMLIFNFVPIYGLTLAFKNYSVISGIGGSTWNGLDNFKTILQDKYFWESVVNTFGISAIKLSVGFVIARQQPSLGRPPATLSRVGESSHVVDPVR